MTTTLERSARLTLEWWRAGARTRTRLITLADHFAYQYRADAAQVYADALALTFEGEVQDA